MYLFFLTTIREMLDGFRIYTQIFYRSQKKKNPTLV